MPMDDAVERAPTTPVTTTVKIHLTHPESRMPQKATAGAAAFDVYARVNVRRTATIKVPLGFRLQMPPGMYAKLHGRSGHALTEGFVAHEGIIDQDYTGELCMIIQIPPMGIYDTPIVVGERVGQMTFHHCVPVVFEEVSEIQETARGAGGFGSTGTGALPTPPRSATPGSPLDEARQACLGVVRSPLGKRESPSALDGEEEPRSPPPSVASSPATSVLFPPPLPSNARANTESDEPTTQVSISSAVSASGGIWR